MIDFGAGFLCAAIGRWALSRDLESISSSGVSARDSIWYGAGVVVQKLGPIERLG